MRSVQTSSDQRWPPWARDAGAATLTVLSAALVVAALTAPTSLEELRVAAFLRLPVEVLLLVLAVLVLPTRFGRVATVAGCRRWSRHRGRGRVQAARHRLRRGPEPSLRPADRLAVRRLAGGNGPRRRRAAPGHGPPGRSAGAGPRAAAAGPAGRAAAGPGRPPAPCRGGTGGRRADGGLAGARAARRTRSGRTDRGARHGVLRPGTGDPDPGTAAGPPRVPGRRGVRPLARRAGRGPARRAAPARTC